MAHSWTGLSIGKVEMCIICNPNAGTISSSYSNNNFWISFRCYTPSRLIIIIIIIMKWHSKIFIFYYKNVAVQYKIIMQSCKYTCKNILKQMQCHAAVDIHPNLSKSCIHNKLANLIIFGASMLIQLELRLIRFRLSSSEISSRPYRID